MQKEISFLDFLHRIIHLVYVYPESYIEIVFRDELVLYERLFFPCIESRMCLITVLEKISYMNNSLLIHFLEEKNQIQQHILSIVKSIEFFFYSKRIPMNNFICFFFLCFYINF